MERDDRSGLWLPERGMSVKERRELALSDDRFASLLPPISGGGAQSWVECLVASTVDGPTITAAGAVTCLPSHAVVTVPANFFFIGKVLRITMAGRMSNAVTTPGNFTIDVRSGPTSNIIVFNAGALLLSTTAHTTLPFMWRALLTCRAVGNGTTANLMGQSMLTGQPPSVTAVADASATTMNTLMGPNVTPVVGTGFDSTVANTINVFCNPSLSTASFTVHQYTLEALN